jgi:hypothetical protein
MVGGETAWRSVKSGDVDTACNLLVAFGVYEKK